MSSRFSMTVCAARPSRQAPRRNLRRLIGWSGSGQSDAASLIGSIGLKYVISNSQRELVLRETPWLRAAWIEGSRNYLSLLRWYRDDLQVDFQPVDRNAVRHRAMGALLPSRRLAEFGSPWFVSKACGTPRSDRRRPGSTKLAHRPTCEPLGGGCGIGGQRTRRSPCGRARGAA